MLKTERERGGGERGVKDRKGKRRREVLKTERERGKHIGAGKAAHD